MNESLEQSVNEEQSKTSESTDNVESEPGTSLSLSLSFSLSLFLYFSSFRIIETFEPVKIEKQSFDTVYMLFGARMLRKNVSFVSTYEK